MTSLYQDFEDDFEIVKASETVSYTALKLTSFVDEKKELNFQFKNSRSIIYFKYADVRAPKEESSNVLTLEKKNGLKEYKITFSSDDHKKQFMEFF